MGIKKRFLSGISVFILMALPIMAIEEELALDINNLNEEYINLQQKEQSRFNSEKEKAKISEKRLEILINLKNKLEKNLENTDEIKEQRFFKDDYEKLIKKYRKYLKEVNKEIKIQEKNIAEFLMLKELRGE